MEEVQGPAGDVEALAAAISARLFRGVDRTLTAADGVLVSEETLARDSTAQGEAEFEGADGPTARRNPDPQLIKVWLAHVCRAHGLSCTYDRGRRGYIFRRARLTANRV